MPDNSRKPGPDPAPAGKDPGNGSEAPARNVIEMARERISLERERRQTARRMSEALNEMDERQFQDHMARLENEKLQQQADERHDLRMYRLLVGGVSATLALLVFLVLMLFFGDERQSGMAFRMLEVGAQTIAAGSFFALAWLGARRLFHLK